MCHKQPQKFTISALRAGGKIGLPICVVYFDQHLGAAHYNSWSKYAFSHFLREKCKKAGKNYLTPHIKTGVPGLQG